MAGASPFFAAAPLRAVFSVLVFCVLTALLPALAATFAVFTAVFFAGAFELFVAGFVMLSASAGGLAGLSRKHSIGVLSGRSPRKEGCLSLPSSVHSVKCTWATSRGLTHVASLILGASRSAGFSTTSRSSASFNSRRSLAEKPVPTFPAKCNSCPSDTASRSDPSSFDEWLLGL